MKRIRRTPRGNRCDKSQDSQGILLFVLKRGKIAISRQPRFPPLMQFSILLCFWIHMYHNMFYLRKIPFDFFMHRFRYIMCLPQGV